MSESFRVMAVNVALISYVVEIGVIGRRGKHGSRLA